jgi:CheY-like chemotaxis protein
VEIAVEDTGIGIPLTDLERIFSGFEQVDGSAARRYGGAGIGLALVRTLVTLHGGTVRAESSGAGQGARFVVRLPALAPMATKRILVVEDDARVREPLCVFLRDAGYAVEGAPTARSALDAIAERPPDLVVLDIGLPDMDGWEVLRHVREGDRTQTLPVLVLTGLGDEKAEAAKTLGADEFVAKPVSPPVIIGIVQELLGQRAGRARWSSGRTSVPRAKEGDQS